MSDARAKAEEALANYDVSPWQTREKSAWLMAEALRALLSEKSPAPPADAATEAVREVIDAWQAAQDARLNVPIRLASALFRLSALPAPAPSAKEGRT